MHRIDTPTAQKDKFGAGKNGFTRGNPQTGTPATDLDDDYFDMLQEELAAVVEYTNVALDKSKRNQLLTAIRALLTGLNLKSASQRDVGTGANQIPDMASFTGNKSANGWQKLPGGLILQWGNAAPTSGSTNIGFPIAFPQNPYFVGAGYRQANFPSAMQSIVVNDTTLTTTGCTVRNLQYDGSSMAASASAFFWFAIG